MYGVRKAIESIATDRKLVFYGILLLALHIAGILLLYDLIPEFDNLNHFWFGFVLSEYSSKGADSMGLQLRLARKSQEHGWTKADPRKVDFLVRLTGFLLIGGLLWESFELFFNPLVGVRPDSFLAFPITLQNIDGTLDVIDGILGATLAFFLTYRKSE